MPRDKSPGGCGAAGSLGAGRRSAEGSARVGIGARATAAGPAQGFIYKRSLQSKFLSILTLLPPVVVPPAPPQPSSPSLSRVLSVWSFVILAETLSTGEQNFLLLFPMPVQPLAQSQKHSRCLSKRPWRGRGGENARGRAPAAFCYCLPSKERGDEAPQHRHGRSLPSPRSLLLAHQPHNGAISKISPAGLSQGRSPPPPQASSAPTRGVEGQPGEGGTRFSIGDLFQVNSCCYFFSFPLLWWL